MDSSTSRQLAPDELELQWFRDHYRGKMRQLSLRAVIMGGIGSFWGAMIGGLIIGVSEEMITGLLQNFVHILQLDADMSVYKPAVAFVLVVVILLLRPHGIFGKKEA